MSREEHTRAFATFGAGLLADAGRYLSSSSPGFLRNGFSYHTAAMWLTEAEYTEFARDIQTAVQPRLASPPGKGRKRRMAFIAFVPAPEEQAGGGETSASAEAGRAR